MIQEVRLAELLEDETLYPRETIDETHISDMVRSIQAGHSMPHIVADAKMKRVVDGVHRRRAWLRVLGPDGAVKVDLRDYKNEQELFLDAVKRNAHHGKKLSRVDQVRVHIFSQRLGISDEQTARALSVPVEHVRVVLEGRVAGGPSGPTVTKYGSEHLGGQSITQEQIDAIKRQRGVQTARLARELIDRLESGIANLEDKGLCNTLHDLADIIKKLVPKERKAA